MAATEAARDLVPLLTTALAPHGFVVARGPLPDRAGGATVIAGWTRKTWNTNRAVIVVEDRSNDTSVGAVARTVRDEIAKPLGYLYFLYGLGLQVIVVGRDLGSRVTDLDVGVDKIDNQWAIVQSIHAVDLTVRRRTSARTWGQLVSGRFQDAIERTVDEWLGPAS
jgi:hypothetical protein